MKALILDQPGKVASIRLDEREIPPVAAGEIRVKVAASGVNPVDYKLAGRGNPAWNYPHVLGLDVAGTVEVVGPGVDRWQVGDRVYYHGDLNRPNGGFAEYATTTAHTVAAIPPSVSFTAAAALPCAGLTAYQGLIRRLQIKAGQTVWIQGGAGGVGGFGVQLAAAAGATVITTASPTNAEHVTRLGAAHVIDYNREDVVGRIMEITEGRGVDAVQAAVDTQTADQGIEVLCFAGAISCIAGLPTLGDQTFAKAISLHKISLGAAHQSNNSVAQEDLGHMAAEMIGLVEEGIIDPMVEQVISLEEIPAGLAQLEGRHVRGKIVAVFEG
ncbi:MAG: zinc-binding dehydrogenase [Candidatus Latescibacteria bacterium]|nr:zinc-binding dehydrogenase [Candidatus Latescibacterota bacterium]